MADLKISELIEMQQELQAKYEGIWEPVEPERSVRQMLWMIEEIGEVIAIIKKRTPDGIMDDFKVWEHFLEEMSDVLMYFIDVLDCLDVTSKEFCEAYIKKHKYNMKRDFQKQHGEYLTEEDDG